MVIQSFTLLTREERNNSAQSSLSLLTPLGPGGLYSPLTQGLFPD